MRARWEALHLSLLHSVNTLDAKMRFDQLRHDEPALLRFTDTGALRAYLNSREGDLDEKDQILGALIRAARDGNQDLAICLSMLGLWPGLDAVYGRLIRHFRDDPDDLASQITWRFSMHVHSTNLTRVNRVAATLVLNTRRDIVTELRSRWRDSRRYGTGRAGAARQDITGEEDPFRDRAGPMWGITDLGAAIDMDGERHIDSIRAWLRVQIGTDADLVVDVYGLGLSQKEAAARLGISHEAARKRVQRALEHLRKGSNPD